MIQGTIDKIFGVIWITMLTFQIGNPANMGEWAALANEACVL